MTERKILFALKKIDNASTKNFWQEALLNNYHLNVDLLKLIYSTSALTNTVEEKKLKTIISELCDEIDKNPSLKTIIAKKNLKIVKVWTLKMDDFFKTLKHKQPTNTKILFIETQKIFAILNISAHKIFAQGKRVQHV